MANFNIENFVDLSLYKDLPGNYICGDLIWEGNKAVFVENPTGKFRMYL